MLVSRMTDLCNNPKVTVCVCNKYSGNFKDVLSLAWSVEWYSAKTKCVVVFNEMRLLVLQFKLEEFCSYNSLMQRSLSTNFHLAVAQRFSLHFSIGSVFDTISKGLCLSWF